MNCLQLASSWGGCGQGENDVQHPLYRLQQGTGGPYDWGNGVLPKLGFCMSFHIQRTGTAAGS